MYFTGVFISCKNIKTHFRLNGPVHEISHRCINFVQQINNKSTTEHPYSMLHYASCFCSLPLSLPWVSQGGTRSLMNRSFSSALALASFLKSSAALAMINAFNQIPTSFTYILAQIYFNLSENFMPLHANYLERNPCLCLHI